MPRLLLVLLPCLALAVLSCASLAAAGPPALLTSQPVAIQSSQEQDGVVKLEANVWRRTYAVSGASIEEIARNLDALRPARVSADFRAETEWDLSWTLRYAHAAGSCSIAALTLKFDALVTLPSLADDSLLHPDEHDRWQRYADALEQHEQGHLDRELDGARELMHRFNEVGLQPDCSTVAAAVSAIGEQAKNAIRLADESFDADTNHGASAGAVFP